MRVRFEELSPAKRAGGIEIATRGLTTALSERGVSVSRSSEEATYGDTSVPDCVHIHGLWSLSLMAKWLHWRRRGVPCVVTVHGMLEPWAMNHKRWKKLIGWYGYQKRFLNRADVIHATSDREAESVQRLKLRPQIETIPWGTDLPPLTSQSQPSSRSKIALFVGRIYPVKGLPLLVEAWAKVKPRGWTMRIVGPDQAGHRGEVEALVQKVGQTGHFEFMGPLSGSALQQAYDEADLFVLPSHTENFGMAAAEALANGLPVLTTHGTPWELLERERCGWWVPVDVESIASALEHATQCTSAELSAMGARGREVVRQRFSWDKIACDFISCYERILNRPVARS